LKKNYANEFVLSDLRFNNPSKHSLETLKIPLGLSLNVPSMMPHSNNNINGLGISVKRAGDDSFDRQGQHQTAGVDADQDLH
jgi:hypothetical protein